MGAMGLTNERPELDPTNQPSPITATVFEFRLSGSGGSDEAIASLRGEGFLVNPVIELGEGRSAHITDRIILVLREDVSRADLASSLSEVGCALDRQCRAFEDRWFARIVEARGRSSAEIVEECLATDLLKNAYPEVYASPILSTPPDSAYEDLQWPLDNRGGLIGGMIDADVDAPLAWEAGMGDTSVTVAVIDANFSPHEDTSAKSSQISFQEAGLYSGTMYWACSSEAVSCDRKLSCTHGTSVLSVMAAAHNGFGIDGIAPRCKYVGISVWSPNWQIAPEDAAYAVYLAAFGHNADIIVHSWDIDTQLAGEYEMTLTMLQAARDSKHAAIFVPAGNGGPGSISKWAFASDDSAVFTIGATNKYDGVWSSSGTGSQLDFSAPTGDGSLSKNPCRLSDGIPAWDVMGAPGLAPCCNPSSSQCNTASSANYLCGGGGTSLACPVVAGVAALVLSRRPDFRNSADVGLALYNVLKITSEDKGDSGFDTLYGWGRVNAARAVAHVSRGDVATNGVLNVVDVSEEVNLAFRNKSCANVHMATADLNCDGVVTVVDVTTLVGIVFRKQPQLDTCTSLPSSSVSCCPHLTPLEPVGDTAIYSSTVSLKWESEYWARRFRVQVAEDSYFHDVVFSDTTAGNVNFYEVSGLNTGKYYYWRVSAAGYDCVERYSAGGRFRYGTIADPPSLAYEDNSVVVESKHVMCGDTGVSVGIYVSNDFPLGALILPLELRAVSGNAFTPSAVTLSTNGRLDTSLVSFVTIGYYPEKDAQGGSCSGYDTPHDSCDGISPDGVLYAGVSNGDSLLWPGSDGEPGDGTPSLLLRFDVETANGTFEIDTTCMAPSNHLMFVDGLSIDEVPTVIPSFTKGTVTVGGIEELSGHVVSCDTLGCEVTFTDDVTIDSGAALTILPSARISVADSASLMIFGELIFDTSTAGRPEFSCDSGSWRGIWILQGGTADWGGGCVINDANAAITIGPGATSSEIRNVTVNDPITAGFDLSESVGLTNDTINASGADYGVILNGCDPTIESMTISGCATGIYAVGSAGQFGAISINGPGAYGIYAMTDAENPGEDTLTLDQVDIVGHFSGAHFHAEPSAHALIDGCNFLTEAVDSLQSHFGIKAYDDAFVRVRNSLILNCDTAFYSYNSKADLGTSGSSGNNSIYRDSCVGSCPGSKLYAECELDLMGEQGEGSEMDGPGGPPPPDPICLMKAEGNWWGSSSPSSSWFTNVDYNPWLNDDPLGKLAIWAEADAIGTNPNGISVSNYPNPFNSSTEIEFVLPSPERVRIDVYNVLGQVVKTLINRDFEAGEHRVVWDATNKNSQPLASGVYLYRIVIGDFTATSKMLLLK